MFYIYLKGLQETGNAILLSKTLRRTTMQRLTRMHMKLQMDRPINPKEHYIMPGGYEICEKHFDFNKSSGSVSKENPNQIEFWVSDFDDELGMDKYDGVPVAITPEEVDVGFAEFYMYVGEYDDPEINPEKILELDFEFYDEEKDEYFTKEASENVKRGINEIFEGDKPFYLYYVSYSAYTDDDWNLAEFEGEIGMMRTKEFIENPAMIDEFYDDEQGTESGVAHFRTYDEAKKFAEKERAEVAAEEEDQEKE